MNSDRQFCAAFRRAVTFFPAPAVTIESVGNSLKPDGFCAASFDPPIVALTFARGASGIPGPQFSISTIAVTLHCSLLEMKEVGGHTMLFAAVQRVEMCVAPAPPVNWRRACFELRLNYPFLESAGALETFVAGWRACVLKKSAWTHAAHVAVTGYYAFDNPPETVFTEMKRGILAFNTAVGGVNGPDSGYHETLTRFWSNMITTSLRDHQPKSRLDAATCAVRIFGEDRDLPALFYSFDVVRDRHARREWVLPDQQPLKEWCGK
jgi:hypothetical protein